MFWFVCVLCFISSTKKLEVGSRHLFSSPAPEPATAEAAKASAPKSPAATKAITAESAKSTSTAAAITAESATATEPIKAAALKALETLARKVTTRPVLSLAVQITGPASTPGPIETASR
jgi:hypothetical protein